MAPSEKQFINVQYTIFTVIKKNVYYEHFAKAVELASVEAVTVMMVQCTMKESMKRPFITNTWNT